MESDEIKQGSSQNIDKEQILRMRLSEFSSLDTALKIYSGILDSEIWFCSNSEISSRIKGDYPEAVTFTAYELKKLYKLNPSPDDLRSVFNVKSEFKGSKILGGRLEKKQEHSTTKPDE